MALRRSCSVILWLWYVALWSCLHSNGATAAPPTDINPNVTYYNTRNTTEGSVFLRNLDHVLDSLAKSTPITNSSSNSSGTYPDDAYGFYECYNMSQSGYGQCFNSITQDFRSICPLAVGAKKYLNTTRLSCYLRYENYNFLSMVLALVKPVLITPFPGSPPPPPPSNSSPAAGAPPNSQPSSDKGSKSNRTKIILGIVIPLAALLLAALAAYFTRCKGKKRRGNGQPHGDDLEGNLQITRAYRYKELRAATEDFAEHNKLGQGGFGAVYKGTLRDGKQVAVKKLLLVSRTGNDDFVNEVNVISSIQHRNLVKLEGYCIEEQQRMLVLEYVDNGNLGDALFRKNIELDWPSRYEIILGIARGLAYLHEESHIQIIHRDIKANNILLDSKLSPKISDFGLSKLFDSEKEFASTTRLAGTYGYLAPEYAMRGTLTAKVDIFSYGVLVLEIISGRRASDPSLGEEEELLLDWAWKLYTDGILETLIDPHLDVTTSNAWALRALNIALLCTQLEANSRPTMSQVVAMLLDYLLVPPIRSGMPAYFGRPAQVNPRDSSTATSNNTRSTTVSSASQESLGPR